MEVEYIVDYVDFKTFEKACIYIRVCVSITNSHCPTYLEIELLSKKRVGPCSWCVIN